MFVLAVPALGGTGSTATIPRPVAGHPVFEMRIGADRVDPTHPFLCAEGTPLAFLSIEACGTGSGVIHNDPAPDMAHFRARGRVLGTASGRGTVDWLVGAGWTEVQSTIDEPGFKFGQPQSPEQVEAAGPEVSTSAKARYWFDPGARTYLSGDFNVGVATIPGAPQVMGAPSPVVPFAALTLGLGF
jgi:hypothetical protein